MYTGSSWTLIPTANIRLAYTFVPRFLHSHSHTHTIIPKKNVESWKEKIRAPLVKALATPIKMVVDEFEIVGMKAIVECSGYAIQKNGRPYNNKYVLLLWYWVTAS